MFSDGPNGPPFLSWAAPLVTSPRFFEATRFPIGSRRPLSQPNFRP
nr:MAG TPA: hypothetical protein [Caudoviricetes sp.]